MSERERILEIIDDAIENKFRGQCVLGVEHLKSIRGYIENQNVYINELENKLMYALSPTSHELATTTQEHFKEIIRDNLERDTYTIKRALKKYWEDK
jgi:hypothetical protein